MKSRSLRKFIRLFSQSKPSLKREQGIMLIELMISLLILTTLSLTVFQFSRRAFIDKGKIERKISEGSKKDRLRSLLQADIYKAFDFQNINHQIYSAVQEERVRELNDLWKKIKENKANEYEKFYGPSNEKEYQNFFNDLNVTRHTKLTHFVGKKNFMHFTTTHHTRTMKDSAESDIVEVGYFLKPCKSLDKSTQFESCLWRRISLILDDEVSKGGTQRVILEGVNKFQLSYAERIYKTASETKVDWKDEWISTYKGASYSRGKFPLAVLVSLSWEEKRKERGKDIEKDLSLEIVTPLMLASLPKKKK